MMEKRYADLPSVADAMRVMYELLERGIDAWFAGCTVYINDND